MRSSPGDGGLWPSILAYRVPAVVAAGAIGNVILSHWLWTTQGWMQATLGAAELACVATPSLVTTVSHRRRENERVKGAAVLNGVLGPLAAQLATLSATTDRGKRAQRAAAARDSGIAALAASRDIDEVRVIFFGQDADEPETLHSQHFFGRADPPTSRFRRDDPRGRAVFAEMETGVGRVWSDLTVEQPEGWHEHGQAYQSLVQVGVRSAGLVHGLISMDARRPGYLTHDDLGTAQTVAAMVATAMAMVEGRGGDDVDGGATG